MIFDRVPQQIHAHSTIDGDILLFIGTILLRVNLAAFTMCDIEQLKVAHARDVIYQIGRLVCMTELVGQTIAGHVTS